MQNKQKPLGETIWWQLTADTVVYGSLAAKGWVKQGRKGEKSSLVLYGDGD